ncbi:efflux RND transporter periplasmic adaptor subunit [Hylemonella gracilis]|uniref:RND family efflux transporter MFP subunit n=1 Tax=Hylemonella gracilis ATCC 19624 TaxID=887062 RepID=F3KQ39_9BURK|nr:efflux RND transporter periplasmic adaptor subunit [Hylemonella gracilis]EGI78207.1 RND family efflux transporter MFP subunit [Hylemonella gracilis ATCC 19624]
MHYRSTFSRRASLNAWVAAALSVAIWPLSVQGAQAVPQDVQASPPPSIVVRAAAQPRWVSLEATVEAVRETTVSAQVQGAILELRVKAGDTVRAGQPLVRIDGEAAQVQRDVAAKEYERQRQLFDQQFISQGALDRALAQARASQVQTDFHVLTAPYAGVVREVPVALGDMAMPGRPLLVLYDPAALRVTVSVPQALLSSVGTEPVLRYELNGQPSRIVESTRLLPAVDPVSHTAQLRFDLPKSASGVVPGMYVRVWLAAPEQAAGRILVPATALVRRGDMTGVYVVGAGGQARLRQVRPGPAEGERVEILSGVADGDRVVTDAQRALRLP